jgi:glycosyltransferase involved in cell wall biosynthesis
MASTPLVSIIVPCYNYGKFLSDALESVLSQTYANWECFVVDDGSTDNTKEVSTRYEALDSRFKYVYQKNRGLAGARNTALKLAKGKYVQLLDADDMLEPEKLSFQVLLLESQPEVDLVYSNILAFTRNDRPPLLIPFKMKAPVVSGKGETLVYGLMKDNIFLPGCAIFKRTLYEQVGGFKPGMGGLEDWNYWFRAALLGAAFYNDTRNGTHLLMRNHGNNMSANHKAMEYGRIKAREDIMEVTKELQDQNKVKLSQSFLAKTDRLHLALLNRDMARYNLYYGNFFKGLKQVMRHAFLSGEPYFAVYDAAYWIKERVKANLTKT